MYTEQEKCARYIVACINEFALQKKLDKRTSFKYLSEHNGIAFFKGTLRNRAYVIHAGCR